MQLGTVAPSNYPVLADAPPMATPKEYRGFPASTLSQTAAIPSSLNLFNLSNGMSKETNKLPENWARAMKELKAKAPIYVPKGSISDLYLMHAIYKCYSDGNPVVVPREEVLPQSWRVVDPEPSLMVLCPPKQKTKIFTQIAERSAGVSFEYASGLLNVTGEKVVRVISRDIDELLFLLRRISLDRNLRPIDAKLPPIRQTSEPSDFDRMQDMPEDTPSLPDIEALQVTGHSDGEYLGAENAGEHTAASATALDSEVSDDFSRPMSCMPPPETVSINVLQRLDLPLVLRLDKVALESWQAGGNMPMTRLIADVKREGWAGSKGPKSKIRRYRKLYDKGYWTQVVKYAKDNVSEAEQ